MDDVGDLVTDRAMLGRAVMNVDAPQTCRAPRSEVEEPSIRLDADGVFSPMRVVREPEPDAAADVDECLVVP